MTSTGYDDLKPETRAIIERAEAIAPQMDTPEFEHLGPPRGFGPLGTLLFTRACTSLSNDEATERINLMPPMGDHGAWVLLTEEGNGGPVPCQDKPETHRHLMWEC